jgi:hypothetical protein
MLMVERKPGETGTAFCGTVMNITLEAEKQTKGKLLYQLRVFHVTPTAAAVQQDACGLAHLHTRSAGLNFVWGTKDVQNHVSYEILGALSGISEY